MVVAAWLWTKLPWWGLLLLGLVVFLLLMIIIERGLRSLAHLKAITGPEGVDRLSLADECQNLAQSMLSLISEHTGPIQAAWGADIAHRSADGAISRAKANVEHPAAVGKLIEKFGERFHQKAWSAVYAASRVVDIYKEDIFRFQHGIRSEHDINEFAIFMTKLSADLRYGQQDRGSERHPYDQKI